MLGILRVSRILSARSAWTGLVGEGRSGDHKHRHHGGRQSVGDLLHAKPHPLSLIPTCLYVAGARADYDKTARSENAIPTKLTEFTACWTRNGRYAGTSRVRRILLPLTSLKSARSGAVDLSPASAQNLASVGRERGARADALFRCFDRTTRRSHDRQPHGYGHSTASPTATATATASPTATATALPRSGGPPLVLPVTLAASLALMASGVGALVLLRRRVS
jgi:hypothetical protein